MVYSWVGLPLAVTGGLGSAVGNRAGLERRRGFGGGRWTYRGGISLRSMSCRGITDWWMCVEALGAFCGESGKTGRSSSNQSKVSSEETWIEIQRRKKKMAQSARL